MAASSGRKGRPWRRLVALAKQVYPPVCWLCWKPINLGLHYNHRMAWTLDHTDALVHGGAPEDIGNVRPAHRSCNSSKGARVLTAAVPPPSRDW